MTSIIVNRRGLADSLMYAVIANEIYDEDEDDFDVTYGDCTALLATRAVMEPIRVADDHADARPLEIGTLVLVSEGETPRAIGLNEIRGAGLRIPVPSGNGDDAAGTSVTYLDPFSIYDREKLNRLIDAAGDPPQDSPVGQGLRNARRWAEAIDAFNDDIRFLVQQDPDAVPQSLATNAWMAAATDRYGDVELPNGLSRMDLWKYARAQELRRQIGSLAPGHQDALAPEARLDEVIGCVAQMTVGMRYATGVRGGVMRQSDEMIRMIQGNDRLCREVFGAATATKIENLQCATVIPDDLRAISASLTEEGHRIDAEWSQAVKDSLGGILGEAMPGYRFDADLFAVDGRDILAVRDHAGAYLYSWPTDDRRPMVEIGNRLIAAIGADDVPGDDELARLEQVCVELTGAAEYGTADHARREPEDRGQDFDM